MRLPAIILIVVLSCVSAYSESSVIVCSFNIQFLGSSKKRDNEALASVLKSFDIVVVQELVAPPFDGTFPNGEKYKPDPEAAQFFKEMSKAGFTYAMSQEDTGTGNRIHLNSSATEWWVAFFKSNRVDLAPDLPTGFLAEDRSNHPHFERVPFAFGFRSKDKEMDFVLISVHLMPGKSGKARRREELGEIGSWIMQHNQKEKDFIVLGDMNIEDPDELERDTPPGFVSLNRSCLPTNTNVKGPKPYDHVMYSAADTKEIDLSYGFRLVNLIEAMKPRWQRRYPQKKYPGEPYNHDEFRAYYSDHHPVVFRLSPAGDGDDD